MRDGELLRLERDLLLTQRDILLGERDELLSLVLAAVDGVGADTARDVRLAATVTERELLRAERDALAAQLAATGR